MLLDFRFYRFFDDEKLSQSVTILHTVCLWEMLNFKRMCIIYETQMLQRKPTANDF